MTCEMLTYVKGYLCNINFSNDTCNSQKMSAHSNCVEQQEYCKLKIAYKCTSNEKCID